MADRGDVRTTPRAVRFHDSDRRIGGAVASKNNLEDVAHIVVAAAYGARSQQCSHGSQSPTTTKPGTIATAALTRPQYTVTAASPRHIC
jgi:hypothetical protein